MNASEFAKGQLEMAFGLVNQCAGGMDDAQYNFEARRHGEHAAKSHVHAITSLDFFLTGIAQGKPLAWTEFARPARPAGEPDGDLGLRRRQSRWRAMKEYAQQVQKNAAGLRRRR